MFDTSFTGVLHVFYRCVTGVRHCFFPGVLQVCYRCFTGVLQVCDRCWTLLLHVFHMCFPGVLQVFYRCVCGNSLVCVQTMEEGERGWTDIPGVHRLQGLIHSFAGGGGGEGMDGHPGSTSPTLQSYIHQGLTHSLLLPVVGRRSGPLSPLAAPTAAGAWGVR